MTLYSLAVRLLPLVAAHTASPPRPAGEYDRAIAAVHGSAERGVPLVVGEGGEGEEVEQLGQLRLCRRAEHCWAAV